MVWKKAIAVSVACVGVALGAGGCSTIGELRAIRDEQNHQLRELTKESQSYKEAYDALRLKYEAAGRQYSETLEREQREKASLKSTHDRQTAEIEQGKREIVASYESRLDARATDENTIKQQVRTLENEKQSLESRLQETEANRDTLGELYDTTKGELEQRNKDYDKEQARASGLETRVASVEKDVRDRDATIGQLSKDVAAAKARADNAANNVATSETVAEKGLSQLRAQVAGKDTEIAARDKTIQEKDEALRQQQANAEAVAKERNSLRDRLTETDLALRRKRYSEEAVLVRLEKLRNVLDADDSASFKVGVLKGEIDSLTDETAKAREGVLPPLPEIKTLYDKITSTLSELIDQKMLSVRTVSRGVSIVIPADNLFDSTNRSKVRTTDKVIDMLTVIANLGSSDLPEGVSIMVEGHTDSDQIKVGLFMDNLHLSMLRAVNVTRKLTIDLRPSIPSERVRAVACGEHFPISSRQDENRRVEIVFMSPYWETVDAPAADAAE